MLKKDTLVALAYLSNHQNYSIKKAVLLDILNVNDNVFENILAELRHFHLINEDPMQPVLFLNIPSYHHFLMQHLSYYPMLVEIVTTLQERIDGIYCLLDDMHHIIVVDRYDGHKYISQPLMPLVQEYQLQLEVVNSIQLVQQLQYTAMKRNLFLNLKVSENESTN